MKLLLVLEPSVQFIVFCIFCLSILLLLWYYLYYFTRLAFHKEKNAEPVFPPATIILCAKNEDHNLPEFLPLILGQDYPEYEVIVVEDCSWDNTAQILKEFEKKYSRLKVITIKGDEKHPHGKKFALMVGIKGAKHEHLLLTDGDCRPVGDQWLKQMIKNFSGEKEIVLGYSKYEKQNTLLNKLIRFDTFHIALQYLSFAKAGRPYMGIGRNLAYKKSLFFKHKGFASHYHIESGDDDLFINEAATSTNTTIEISQDSFTVSRVKKSFKGWIDQKRRHLTTWTSYKTSDKIILGIYSAAQIFFWISFAVLLLFQYELYPVLSLFFIRIIAQFITFKLVMDKLKEKDLLLTSLFVELFLLVFYLVLTISNSLFRRKKWKTL